MFNPLSRLSLSAWFIVMLLAGPAAGLELAAPFGDHAVLQRDAPLLVWGWAEPGEAVTVTFKAQEAAGKADEDGRWEVTLDTEPASAEPAELRVQAESGSATATDVLVGEVWLASGQSNMAWSVRKSDDAEAVMAAADRPLVRQLTIPRRHSDRAMDRVKAPWQVASAQTVGDWSAVAYHFSVRLHDALGVPVGVMNVSVGGTPIEAWTPVEGMEQVEATRPDAEVARLRDPTSKAHIERAEAYLRATDEWLQAAKQTRQRGESIPAPPAYPDELAPSDGQRQPAVLYKGMMHAVVGTPIRGAIWYQGEANHRDGDLYFEKTRALLAGWRDAWDMPDMPYYFVQLAPFNYGDEANGGLPKFWTVQERIDAELPHTGMVVINDIGDIGDIHPTNKHDVGLRLANLALSETYGKGDLVARSATVSGSRAVGDRYEVTFDHVGEGLKTRDGASPDSFEVTGEDGEWVTAEARITGPATVTLTSPRVESPVAARFAWNKTASPNLVNSAGLPTGAFVTGKPPAEGPLADRVPESARYELVYELDLKNLGPDVSYGVDRSATVGPFDRVAYFVELGERGKMRWVYVSMDAFTDDATKIGVPTGASGAFFQRPVENLHVAASADGIENGSGLKGNLEFWSTNYGPPNAANVPGASHEALDHGDRPADKGDYGSFQVHLTEHGLTLFAINNWSRGDAADIGIGNNPDGSPDWTFSKNASDHPLRRLMVLVRPMSR